MSLLIVPPALLEVLGFVGIRRNIIIGKHLSSSSSLFLKGQILLPLLNRWRRPPLFTTYTLGLKLLQAIPSGGALLARAVVKMAGGSGHSQRKEVEFPNVKIVVLSATQDNFMYLIVDKESKQAFVVDPVDPETVLNEVKEQGVTLQGVLTTHHHWDHAGGNADLVKRMGSETKLKVYGGDERVGALTDKVNQGDKITLGQLNFECLFTPCHTSGHICYYLKTSDPSVQKPAVFTGDTLFIAGCGRFFEGTADQMYSALIEKLGKLPEDTMVFCGHEYTIGNLKFGLSVEPDNQDMKNKLQWAQEQRLDRIPTVPSTIEEEKRINPFMRCVEETVQKKIGISEAVAALGKLRNMKDSFKA